MAGENDDTKNEPGKDDAAASAAAAADAVAAAAAKPGDADALKAAQDQLAAANSTIAELTEKVTGFENATKSEKELLEQERDNLRGQVGSLEPQLLKLQVAVSKGLVGDKAFIADLLQGADQAALEKHADELLAKFGGGAAGDLAAGDVEHGSRQAVPAGNSMTDRIRKRMLGG